MNLLKEGIETKAVIPTKHFKKLTIDGHTEDYPVYKIRLDMLYYNDQNDRIATWITQYKLDNGISTFDMSNQEKYNDIIHDFITDSNVDSLRKTQKNMRMFGQQVPGVVLFDGRIIDGNRRFTCLRNIQIDDVETGYFEAAILDRKINDNKKQIKMLELKLQHGEDVKVGYNPIDRLVGIYHDIIDTKLLTIKEYAKSVDQSEKDIELEVEKAKLMGEFLEFINAPKQFHIARIFNLSDPLKELYAMLKKISDNDKKEDLKNNVFAQLFIYSGDTTRYMRKIKKIVGSAKYLDEYLESQSETVYKVCEELSNHNNITNKEINEIRSNDEIKSEFTHATERYLTKTDNDTTRNQPAKQVEKAYDSLDAIDNNILKKLTSEQKEEILERIEMIEELTTKLRSGLDV